MAVKDPARCDGILKTLIYTWSLMHMDNFLSQIKKNITSSIQSTSQTLGGIFGKSQETASSLVRSGSEKIQDILKPLEKLKPEQYDIAIPGPTTGSYKPFKNLYVEAAAQTLGLGARDTDVLARDAIKRSKKTDGFPRGHG